MTLKRDWERLVRAYLKARENSANPHLFLFAHIEDLRKADNKGIDFAIRRLWVDEKYSLRIRLEGGPSCAYPRFPLRVKGRRLFYPSNFESTYIFVELPEFRPSGVKIG